MDFSSQWISSSINKRWNNFTVVHQWIRRDQNFCPMSDRLDGFSLHRRGNDRIQGAQVTGKAFVMFWRETRNIDDGSIFSSYNPDIQVDGIHPTHEINSLD